MHFYLSVMERGAFDFVVPLFIDIGPQLGQRFAQAVDDTVQTVAQFPLRFPVVQKGRRGAGVRRFPDGQFYLVEDTRIVVIACFHGKRNPRREPSSFG